jgi:hypothetical protein
MVLDLANVQETESPAIRLGLLVLNILISLVRLFLSLLYNLASLLTTLLAYLLGLFSSDEGESEEEYVENAVYIGDTDDLSEVSVGCAERTTLIISRVIEMDGTSYFTIDSPRPVDAIYAGSLLSFALQYLQQYGGGTVGGAWMQDVTEVEPQITLTYTPVAGDDDDDYEFYTR